MENDLLVRVLLSIENARKKFPKVNRFSNKIIQKKIIKDLNLKIEKGKDTLNFSKESFGETLYEYLKKEKFVNGSSKLTEKSNEFIKTQKFPDESDFEKLSELLEEYRGLIIKAGVFFNISEKGGAIFKSSLMARFLINRYIFISTEQNDIYYYKNGIYNSGAEGIIKRNCEFFYPEATTHNKNEVIAHIRDQVYIPSELINENPFIIHLDNGIYNVKEDSFSEFSPKIITLNKIPIKYNVDASCDNFLKFVSEIVKEQDINTIQEMIGYCFYKAYPFHKAFMLIGEGRNGKSTLINIINKMVGDINLSNMSLQTINSERNIFVEANLYGKMVNLYPDLPTQSISQTGKFKVLTGNDRITAQRKFKEPISFTNYAKFIFSCNKLPEVKDNTKAFFRRWILLNFPNEFIDGKNANENLLNELTTPKEISGIFNWGMEGLKRLFENKKFSDKLSTEEVQDLYERMSNSLLAFVKEHIEVHSDGWISKDTFFSKYSEYCRDNNLPPKSKTLVGRELAALISVNQGRRNNEKGFRVTSWDGIRFTSKEPEQQKVEGFEKYEEQIKKISELNYENLKSNLSTLEDGFTFDELCSNFNITEQDEGLKNNLKELLEKGMTHLEITIDPETKKYRKIIIKTGVNEQ